MPASLRDLMGEVNSLLEQEVRRVFATAREQAAADDPWSARYLDLLEKACLRPGKGIRPVLVAVGVASVTGDPPENCWQKADVRRAMVIIHLLHKRLLLADDIADRDEVRNENPAFHIEMKTWMDANEPYQHLSEENRAHFARSYSEVAGIWLQQILTTELIALQKEMPSENWHQLAADFNRYAYQTTVAGWITLLDQSQEIVSDSVSRERFLRGLYQVTGGYSFISPLLMGTAFGSLSQKHRDCILEFGEGVGILFQLRDDTLGIFGDTEVTGKPVGGDVREGKKTLYIQEVWKRISAQDKKRLAKLVGNPEITQAEVEWVRTLVKESGANDAVEATIQEYRERAEKALAHWPDDATLPLLQQLISAVVDRTK